MRGSLSFASKAKFIEHDILETVEDFRLGAGWRHDGFMRQGKDQKT
ncbi:hypothetical protein [Methylobacter tundripaludum]|nr:hypothetical protein [Methylobacter tundripaludum]